MKGTAKIKNLRSIVISDPHYEKDVWCRYERNLDKIEDWRVEFIIQSYNDKLKIFDKEVNVSGTEYSILLARPNVNCKLLAVDCVMGVRDIKTQDYEIGVDSAQVAMGTNENADEINEYTKEFNESDVSYMLAEYNPPFAIQTYSDGKYGTVREAIANDEVQYIYINGFFDEDTAIYNNEQLKRYLERQFNLEDIELENEMLTVLYKGVGERPRVMEIEDTLEAKQKLVGGLIEVVPYKDNMLLVCNEEGKVLDMPSNLEFDNDYIAGNCFIVADDSRNEGFKSLTRDEIRIARKDLMTRATEYEVEKDVGVEMEE